ncbi:MAG: anti-sigma factor family protein [Anaerocolumna sp.]
MNCIEVQRLILPFINDELSIKQLDEFLHHINSCPNCKEELEVHYILLSGMKQLDDDKEISDNFHKDFTELLRLSEERVVHNRFVHIRKRIVLVVLISIVAIVSSFRFGEFVVDDVLNIDPKESSYNLNYLFFMDMPGDYEKDLDQLNPNGLTAKSLLKLQSIYDYLSINDEEGAKIMEEKLSKYLK